MKLTYKAGTDDTGRTVKHILKNRMGLSERLTKKLKYQHMITLNSSPVHVNITVRSGDIIEALMDCDEEESGIIPENIPISIIYEDDSLIAVDKQPNIVVHPTCSHLSGTIANALAYHFQLKGIKHVIRPVSRLDRDTSGIIVFAKNPFVQEHLIRQINGKTFSKEYIGVVHGKLGQNEGTIDLPIDRKPGSIMERHISPAGLKSVTHYRVIEQYDKASFLSFRLETGRTHQIRVHCQAIGHPLIGDSLYPSPVESYNDFPIQRQALHSFRTTFIHPVSGNPLELNSPIPSDINALLEIIRK